jgi:ABC-2 type transport system permease protein
MVSEAALESERPFGCTQRLICLHGIVWREGLRFLHQRERFISALVRPMIWLFIFAAGSRQTLGISIMPPYDTDVLYEVYITPGLLAMIQLFNGMQSSLSMVYDREMGSMRMLLVSPAPHWFLLTSTLIAGAAVSILQVYAFLLVAYFWEIEPPTWWGAAGAGPVWSYARRARHGSIVAHQATREYRRRDELRHLPNVFCLLRPLSAVARAGGKPVAGDRLPAQSLHLCGRIDRLPLVRAGQLAGARVVTGCTVAFLGGAVFAYDPARGMLMGRGG